MNNNFKNKDCRSDRIPVWLVLLDNIPTVFLFVMGTVIISYLSAIAAVVFACYCGLSVVLFWARICPYCHFYDTHACPCGYGVISVKLFKKREGKSFNGVFKRNIAIMFPNWFVPFLAGLYMLLTNFSAELLVLTILFSIDGFLVIPVISRMVGCKKCRIKDECPWMAGKKK